MMAWLTNRGLAGLTFASKTRMSAYLIVEATVRDKARGRHSSEIGPTLRKFDGEILAAGSWQSVAEEHAVSNARSSKSVLASPASAMVTGHILTVDGGMLAQ